MNADQFREARYHLKLTQPEMADALGVPGNCYNRQSVWRWENGAPIPAAVEKLIRIMLIDRTLIYLE